MPAVALPQTAWFPGPRATGIRLAGVSKWALEDTPRLVMVRGPAVTRQGRQPWSLDVSDANSVPHGGLKKPHLGGVSTDTLEFGPEPLTFSWRHMRSVVHR